MKYVVVFLMSFLAGQLMAQENIPVGTWRTHFSYYNTKYVVEAGNNIYAATKSGLYFFNKADNSITKLTKINGLQEANISMLCYDDVSKQVFIGYHSGNMDVIKDNKIFNLDLTSTAQVLGPKDLNHMVVYDVFGFLSTAYGVLKLDLNTLEVVETYRELGEGAQPVKVNEAAILNDTLFLATDQGVMAGSLINGYNLLDYRNWKRYGAPDNMPGAKISVMARLDEQLVAGIDEDGLYFYNDGQWDISNILMGETYLSATSGEHVLLIHDHKVSRIMSATEFTAVEDALISHANMAIEDKEGKLWIADGDHGLLGKGGGAFQSFTPSGPFKGMVFGLSHSGNSVYAVSGGYGPGFTPLGSDAGLYEFEEGVWKNYNALTATLPVFKDIVDAEYNQVNNCLYLASAGYGLLQVFDAGEKTIINEKNSPLENLSTTDSRVMVPALAQGNDGMWVLNYGTGHPLHFLDNSGKWESFSFNIFAAQYPADLLIVNNYVWMTIDPGHSGGIVVFNSETGKTRHLTNAPGNGGMADKYVNALALDKEGMIWAGTDKGVSVFSNPSRVMEASVEATEPIYKNRYLLSDESVTAIEVDGGNRKWIGTTNGVWLFNEATDEALINFTTANSPLPDNEILDIEINDNTGEVFFATPKGMVSYRGTATVAGEKHSAVKIFPNPVSLDFKGMVGISGLAADAVVKITDIGGRLIWQTNANGGTATWNVTDNYGKRATTGIYLVFSASGDGKDTYVGKIAIIN